MLFGWLKLIIISIFEFKIKKIVNVITKFYSEYVFPNDFFFFFSLFVIFSCVPIYFYPKLFYWIKLFLSITFHFMKFSFFPKSNIMGIMNNNRFSKI